MAYGSLDSHRHHRPLQWATSGSCRDTGPWGLAIQEPASVLIVDQSTESVPVGCPWSQDFTLAFRILEKEQFNMKMEEGWGVGR